MTAESLLNVLRSSVRAEVRNRGRATIAYSGGLDSSIIAALANEYATVECITCAVKGSFDDLNSRLRAKEEGLSVTLLEITPRDLVKEVVIASHILMTLEPTRIAYTVPLITAVAGSTESTVLAGNGADELFGGYLKYTTMDDPSATMAGDLQKMMRETSLLKTWAETADKRLGFPFTHSEVVDFSNSVPLSLKINGGERKVILKEVARLLNLPSSERPKKAAQYSSGVLRLMERSAISKGLSLRDWTIGVMEQSRRSAYE